MALFKATPWRMNHFFGKMSDKMHRTVGFAKISFLLLCCCWCLQWMRRALLWERRVLSVAVCICRLSSLSLADVTSVLLRAEDAVPCLATVFYSRAGRGRTADSNVCFSCDLHSYSWWAQLFSFFFFIQGEQAGTFFETIVLLDFIDCSCSSFYVLPTWVCLSHMPFWFSSRRSSSSTILKSDIQLLQHVA